MFDLAKFEALCAKRAYLANIARRHMGHTYQWADVDDVVNAGLLAAWQYRDRIETDTRGYIVGCVKKMAALYCKKDALRRIRFYRHVELSMDKSHSLSGNHMMTIDEKAFIDHRTPEVEFIAKAPFDQIEWAAKSLTPAQYKHYSSWVDRDYENETHSQECGVTRCKAALREILVKQKVMKAAA